MGMPFFARLWWDEHRHRGQAICGDVEVELHEAPQILGESVDEIDYSEVHPGKLLGPPEIRLHSYDKRREMRPPEVQAAHDFLRDIAAAVRRVLKHRRRHT